MKKVKLFHANWYCVSAECGEEFVSRTVGVDNVTHIEEHRPAGEGDRHWCDVYFGDDNHGERFFNINFIQYFNDGQK